MWSELDGVESSLLYIVLTEAASLGLGAPRWVYSDVWCCIPGVGDGQGGLACYGSWGRKELDTTEQLN